MGMVFMVERSEDRESALPPLHQRCRDSGENKKNERFTNKRAGGK